MILLKSVCRRLQTAGRNSCSIVSGDVSNCSYRLTVHPVTSLRLRSAYTFFIREERAVTVGCQRIVLTCTAATAVCVFARACIRMRTCVMCLQYTIIIFDPG